MISDGSYLTNYLLTSRTIVSKYSPVAYLIFALRQLFRDLFYENWQGLTYLTIRYYSRRSCKKGNISAWNTVFHLKMQRVNKGRILL